MKNNRFGFLKAVMVAFPLLVLVALLLYFTGVVYFKDHFPFHTTFLGYDISQRELSAIDECMEAETASRTLTLLEMDGKEETIPLGSSINYVRTVKEPDDGWIRQSDPWYWPLSLFGENRLSGGIGISYNEDLLREAIDALDAMDPAQFTPPSDAYLEWQDDILVIVPEVNGDQPDREKLIDLAKTAIESDEETIDLEAEDCYLTAQVLSDDRELIHTVERYAAMGFQHIDIDMTGTTVTLTPEDILSLFYRVNERRNTIKLDEESITAYVSDLKATFDTYELQRPFVNHDGKEITVGTGADTYGFLMDLKPTVDILAEALKSKESTEIRPVWIHEGVSRQENGSDLGDTYIEVSIRDQTLWAYKDGEEILTTEVVTGDTGDHDTPRGVFQINSMGQNVTLVGEDYESFVNYWMQINYNGIGLHDASWRSYFGGNIYTYNGSHGCVNMPYWAASSLYADYSIGTPVVVW